MNRYKIYTYADPFKIPEKSFWKDIRDCPHLCSSRALVTGLTGLYGRDFAPCICTVEDILKLIYPEWMTQVELQIKQRVLISNAVKDLNMSREMKKAFTFNKNDLLESIRFLREINISCDDIDSIDLIPEQKSFVELYCRLMKQYRQTFSLQESLQPISFPLAVADCIKKEIEEKETHIQHIVRTVQKMEASLHKHGPRLKKYRKYLSQQKELQLWLEQQAQKWSSIHLNGKEHNMKVVFHGIHHFTPMRARLIQELESCGAEIVFLHNYVPDYSHVYQTWDKVYSWTGVVPQHDNPTSVYTSNDFYLKHRVPLGEAIGNLLEGNFYSFDLSRLEFLEFDNNTSLANYAGDLYEVKKEFDVEELQGSTVGSSGMDELFYSADYRPVNDILKMHYPELYGERHFLAYPIGQFIMSLYNMWDEKNNSLMIKPHQLKECFNTSLFVSEQGKLNDIFERTRLFFQDIEAVEDYLKRNDMLLENLELLNVNKDLQDLKMVSFYSISITDAKLLKENITRLNHLAYELFADISGDRIDFKKHFKRLFGMISEEGRNNKALNQQEQELLHSLMKRFDNIHKLSIIGSVEDLKESIHYYLKQKETEDEAGWIVRNFEQIEGDVLLSKGQKDKEYHITGLTEKNMKIHMNERLPWPLTENFFTEGCNGKNKSLEIVLTSMKEYKNFLRYALFFGVYYVQQPFRLSFTRHENDKEQQPWFLLNLLGIKRKSYNEDMPDNGNISITPKKDVLTRQVFFEEPCKLDCQAYVFCPNRFVLEKILGEGSAYYNEYLCTQYFMVIFYEKVWKILSGSPFNPEILSRALAEVESELKAFFPFWKPQVDFADKRRKVKQWITSNVAQGVFPEYTDGDQTYLEIKKHFIYAKIKGEDGENQLMKLHRLRPDNPNTKHRKDAVRGIKKLLHGIEDISYIRGLWCEVCKEREVCMESYKKSPGI